MVRVIVVGGGFGGLSTACYLGAAGCSVTVLEKNDQLGGRASVFEQDGFRFDMGPSWYLMPDVFERFFRHFDRHPTDYYDLEQLDPHYRIFYKDGDQVDITGDREQVKRLFERYESGAGETLDRYLAEAKDVYESGMGPFVYTDRPRFRDYLTRDVLRNVRALRLLGSMQAHIESYFEHPKLQQILQYSLVFLGGSPHNTPALYKLMSHVDFNLGVHYPDGGMYAVVDALETLGREHGVTYRTGIEVDAIEGEQGSFRVRSTDGETIEADVVVSDADYAHTEQELLSPSKRHYDEEHWSDKTYAPSAYLMYLGVEGTVEELAHHTLVLPTDWDPHFEQIFDDPAWPDNPAYYVCAPSRTDPSVAPPNHANLFVLVPIAPGLDDGPDVREQFRTVILDDLAKHTGLELRNRIVVEKQFSVSDFANRYNATQGTALGLAHTLRQTGPLRPDHRGAVDGLYFTGSFTRPGIGVPMCLISGEHTADAVIADALDLDPAIDVFR